MKRTFNLNHCLPLALALLFFFIASTQAAKAVPPRYAVGFPDTQEHKTLVCDMHMHTVFSDGEVWPTVRVKEAWRTGLDMIAITDHIEHQPHKKDVPTNHNRSTDMVTGSAATYDLLFAKGDRGHTRHTSWSLQRHFSERRSAA